MNAVQRWALPLLLTVVATAQADRRPIRINSEKVLDAIDDDSKKLLLFIKPDRTRLGLLAIRLLHSEFVETDPPPELGMVARIESGSRDTAESQTAMQARP